MNENLSGDWRRSLSLIDDMKMTCACDVSVVDARVVDIEEPTDQVAAA